MQTVDDITGFVSRALEGRKAVIGISGGIDSAVVLMLLSRAVGMSSVIALFMPDNGTPERDYEDVGLLSRASGIEIRTVNIQNVVDSFVTTLGAEDRSAIGNIKSRVRMTLLYYHANLNRAMVVGTTNRSENLVGYFTKYGDGGCDLEPIIGVYKTGIRKMARELNVPIEIIEKTPSAGLWANQSDEEEMGLTYDELDSILSDLFDRNTGILSEKHEKVYRMYTESWHKRRMPLTNEE